MFYCEGKEFFEIQRLMVQLEMEFNAQIPASACLGDV